MKTTVKIYDRMSNDIPYNSSIYIVNTNGGYAVFKIYTVILFVKILKQNKKH